MVPETAPKKTSPTYGSVEMQRISEWPHVNIMSIHSPTILSADARRSRSCPTHRVTITTIVQVILDLEQEVRRIATAHARLVRAAEAKLRDFGIPTEELGFQPQIVACGVGGGGDSAGTGVGGDRRRDNEGRGSSARRTGVDMIKRGIGESTHSRVLDMSVNRGTSNAVDFFS